MIKQMLKAGVIAGLGIFIGGCGIGYQKNSMEDYAASVINDGGANHYASIAQALSAAPDNSTRPFKIYLPAGNYYEKITIDKPNIQLIGAGQNKTRIYFDAYAGQRDPQGNPWGTFRSATVTITAPRVQLNNLTIENSFNFLANDALDKDNVNRINGTQAVALTLDGASDKFVGRNISLLGYQDTLYANAGRAWFDNSLIAGNVDFIFGKGNALFTDCEIKSRPRAQSGSPQGYLVAPSTHISSDYGFTFINCKLTRAANVPDNSTALGRPWHPTTNFPDGRYADPNAIGKAVFINCWMDAHINKEAWYPMGGTQRDGTKAPFYPEDARFYEYQSSGPGAAINTKRRQLTDQQAAEYTASQILGEAYKK